LGFDKGSEESIGDGIEDSFKSGLPRQKFRGWQFSFLSLGELGTDAPIQPISFFGTHQRRNRPWMVVLGSWDGAASERFNGIGVVGVNAAGVALAMMAAQCGSLKCSGHLHRN
jgi:hypothetical protein